MARISKAREEECLNRLRELVKPGDTVYTLLKHVSKSGMYRVIDLRVIKDNQPIRITTYVADLLEGYDQKHEGAKASGAGMDMGFHLVYNLSHRLFGNGFECVGDEPGRRCPSNDHSNGDRDYTPHWHNSGGYALRQEWL